MQDNRPVGSAVQPCACVQHTFDVLLGPAPDVEPRPDWWPVDGGGSYGQEGMAITLGGVGPRQTLDGGGAFGVRSIPPGVATVRFDTFHDAVLADVDRRTRLAAA